MTGRTGTASRPLRARAAAALPAPGAAPADRRGAGHGYHLAKELRGLRFGRVDRPSVYRALAQLERDGLVESPERAPAPARSRRVYGLTAEGERALREWMGVIKEERDGLDGVLRRYVATGTLDALLAEAEGGWAA